MRASANTKLELQIIDSARLLFAEKGFTETSMGDIAASVGISRPALHYYFRTKDMMFQAVFGSIVSIMLPRVKEIVLMDKPFMKRVDIVLDEYINYFLQHPYIQKFVCDEMERDIDHLLKALRGLQFDEIFLLIRKELLDEMEAGQLKRVPLHSVFYTFYGLLTFPFLSKNLAMNLFIKDEKDFERFLVEWKQYIIFYLNNLFCTEEMA